MIDLTTPDHTVDSDTERAVAEASAVVKRAAAELSDDSAYWSAVSRILVTYRNRTA